MYKEQIREKILFNNKKIEELQPEVQQLMEDNEYLRTICPHEFENGVCKICGKAE